MERRWRSSVDGKAIKRYLRAPYRPLFPYFGGKGCVAGEIWRAFGAIDNYVEPFFGSGAVLFLRPSGARGIETVNDADGLLCNFWRALKRDPEAVAEHADWPVSECDLHARHLWLVGKRESITERLCGDPEWFDAKAAGWWCWGICCWIGGGWCSGDGPWRSVDGEMVKVESAGTPGDGIKRRIPHLGNAGQGIQRRRPVLGGHGISVGINRKLAHLGDAGRGAERRAALVETFRSYADRLRDVRVCCGDWSRVCSPASTINHGLTGVFLDPPYSAEAGRDMAIYARDCGRVAHEVCEWAIANGSDPLMRIVLCGYEGEHAMPEGWRVHEWKTHGGYAHLGNGRGRENSARERLWFSPHCVAPSPGLFDGLAKTEKEQSNEQDRETSSMETRDISCQAGGVRPAGKHEAQRVRL